MKMMYMMTNCPNCGAPITSSRCEYCGTVFSGYRPPSYYSAISAYDEAIKSTRKSRRWMSLEKERLRIENELIEAKTKALVDAEIVRDLYNSAIEAMRAYGRV